MIATKVELFDTGVSCVGKWREARTSNLKWNIFLNDTVKVTKVGTYNVDLQIGYEMTIFVPDDLNPYDYARITDTRGKTYGYHVVGAVPAGSRAPDSAGLDMVTLRADPLWVRDDPQQVSTQVPLRGHATGIGYGTDLYADITNVRQVAGGVAPAVNADELKTVVDISGGVAVYAVLSGSSDILFGDQRALGILCGVDEVGVDPFTFLYSLRDYVYSPGSVLTGVGETTTPFLENLKMEGVWFVPGVAVPAFKEKPGTGNTSIKKHNGSTMPVKIVDSFGGRPSSVRIPIDFKMRKNSVYRIGNQLRSLPIPTLGDITDRDDYVALQVVCAAECGVFNVLLRHGGDMIDITDSLSTPSFLRPSAQERTLDQIQRTISTMTPVLALAGGVKTMSVPLLLMGGLSATQSLSAASANPETAKPLPGMGALALTVPQYKYDDELNKWEEHGNAVGGLAWMRYEDRSINANPNTPWVVDRFFDGTTPLNVSSDGLYITGDLISLRSYRHYPQSDDDARAAFQQGVHYA